MHIGSIKDETLRDRFGQIPHAPEEVSIPDAIPKGESGPPIFDIEVAPSVFDTGLEPPDFDGDPIVTDLDDDLDYFASLEEEGSSAPAGQPVLEIKSAQSQPAQPAVQVAPVQTKPAVGGAMFDAASVLAKSRKDERQERKARREQEKREREAARVEKKKEKKRIVRWRGMMGEAGLKGRLLVLGMIALVSLALTFSHLGFCALGVAGQYNAYAVFLLLPVALTSLLLGTGRGTCMGLFTGAVLFVHSIFLPLDYYEYQFVGFIVAFVLFPFMGFLFGILMSLAMRNEHSMIRHGIYIVIASFFASVFFSAVFAVNVFFQSVAYLAASGISDAASQEMLDKVAGQLIFALSRIGDPLIQILVDFAALAVVLVLAAAICRRFRTWQKEPHSVYSIFNIWLSMAVTAAFLVTATVSFVGITVLEVEAAEEAADNDLAYLADYFQHHADDDTARFLGNYDAQTDSVVLLVSERDGKDVIFADNLPQNVHEEDEQLELLDVFSLESATAIKAGLDNGAFSQVIYDPIFPSYARWGKGGDYKELLTSDGLGNTEIRYAKSKEIAHGAYVTMVVSSAKIHAARPATMVFVSLSIFVVLLVVFLITGRLLKGVVVRRIDDTNATLDEITEGSLNTRVKEEGIVEFDSLAAGINTTVSALDRMIDEAETRRDAELATAKAIQEDALPMDFPAFPNIDKFDIYASMKTAKEVGGDFYDFFEIDGSGSAASGKDFEGGSRVGFMVCDVAGKGLGAGLFMMQSRAQLRNYLESGLPVDEAVMAANHQICLGNDTGMFVTAFVCVIDYETGHIEYVNAGHNPPLVCHGGVWDWKKDVSGMPLGLFDGMPYEKFEFDLDPQDAFYLYTDGVSEAMNEQGELFGEERLKAVLEQYTGMNPRTICVGMRRALTDYVQEAEQSDDITMLCIKYGVPPAEDAIMLLPARRDQLVHVVNYLHGEMSRRKAPKSVFNQVDIAAEEIFVNIASYAYDGAEGEVAVKFDYESSPPTLIVSFADRGRPYNPLEKEDVILPGSVDDMTIGGYGIWMAKNCVDSLEYERVDGQNVLTFKKSW